MYFNPEINKIERYLINDVDRSSYIRLDKNEFNIDFPQNLLKEITQSIDSYVLQAYPSTYKTKEYAAKLLEYEEADNILLVSGSDFGLKLCYESLIPKNANIAIPSPTYAMNEVYAKLSGANINYLSYGEDMYVNKTELFNTLSNVDMIVLANPNQPTGLLEDDVFIKELLTKALDKNCWVVIDEAYYSFSGYTTTKYINEFENLIVLRSFSKSYGIAGIRLGAILSCQKNIDYISKVIPVYNVNSIGLKLLEIFTPYKPYFDDLHKEMIEQRKNIIDYYSNIGCKPYMSDTNFVMIEAEDVFAIDDYQIFLKSEGILIRGPWNKAPYRNAFRITLSNKKSIQKLFEITGKFLEIKESENA